MHKQKHRRNRALEEPSYVVETAKKMIANCFAVIRSRRDELAGLIDDYDDNDQFGHQHVLDVAKLNRDWCARRIKGRSRFLDRTLSIFKHHGIIL